MALIAHAIRMGETKVDIYIMSREEFHGYHAAYSIARRLTDGIKLHDIEGISIPTMTDTASNIKKGCILLSLAKGGRDARCTRPS